MCSTKVPHLRLNMVASLFLIYPHCYLLITIVLTSIDGDNRQLQRDIFYSSGQDSKSIRLLKKDHVMEVAPCSPQGADRLIKAIYGGSREVKKIPKQLKESIPIFQQFLRRYKSCPLKDILSKTCPTSGTYQNKNGGVSNVPYFQVIDRFR